jgi:hypothetical protein
MKLDNATTVKLHRLIVDESHLLGLNGAGKYGRVLEKCTRYVLIRTLPSRDARASSTLGVRRWQTERGARGL